ncbi:hypothetical protein WICPIJ_002485 [Wickerhamomyces pijperi]|uniref:Chromosome segregation in meiosis protein n=1 Tax=Wickerhamomyces pijperi TaxID=599730 RepID=A0A9P8QBQ6_WICPI|nr:hypothetical protein WICPIJ_002485 [Wickerhamomyces pijperi]
MDSTDQRDANSSFADISTTDFAADNVDSILGLHTTNGTAGSDSRDDIITKTKRTRPKITPDLLLSKKGLPYIYDNRKRIIKNLTKSSKPAKNLANFLRIYQLWAHELFPLAKFEDFTQLVSKHGSSQVVKNFRKEWINEDMSSVQGSNTTSNNYDFATVTETNNNNRGQPRDENVEAEPPTPTRDTQQQSNSLFVDEDDEEELYTTTSAAHEASNPATEEVAENTAESNEATKITTSTSVPTQATDQVESDEFEGFSEFEDEIFNKLDRTTKNPTVNEPEKNNNEFEDIPDADDFDHENYQDEFDILNEMGF